jgi:hypothetical protein
MSIGRIVLLTATGFVLLLVFVPGFRNGVTERLTSLSSSSETITVPASLIQGSRLQPSSDGNPPTSVGGNLKLITLLGFDAIPAILDPEFVDVGVADTEMTPDELVLGLSINGESKAYSIPMLSSHEIVNDVVGGVPLAVTW